VNDFKHVAIWIKHVRGVIAGIIFRTSTRRDIVLCARSNCSLDLSERSNLILVRSKT
jgi:hypothetical protein